MNYQKLFETIINITGFTPLQSDMDEIVNVVTCKSKNELSEEVLSLYGDLLIRKDPEYPDNRKLDLSYCKIDDKIFILKWAKKNDIMKDTWIMQIGCVCLDCTELDYEYQLLDLYFAITGKELQYKR